jgi:cobalt-zinc-cadmium efflux system protein
MTEHANSHHSLANANQRRLLVALAITSLMTIVELVGGLMSNSLALLGDAGHMFTDSLALGLSLVALTLAKRPASQTRTYGFHRAEVLAALANGTILVLDMRLHILRGVSTLRRAA